MIGNTLGARLVATWKLLPIPVRTAAHKVVQALQRRATPFLVGRFWTRGARPETKAPVLVAGLMTSSIGVGEGARLTLSALRLAGRRANPLDLGPILDVRSELAPPKDEPALPGGSVITHLNPQELLIALQRTGGRFLRGRRHIGYWAWELPRAPASWRNAFRLVDEVWAPSAFTAEAILTVAPEGASVRVVPHPVHIPDVDVQQRRPPDVGTCRVLTAFDLRSTIARKNPEAAVSAFCKAADEVPTGATLILKVGGAQADPERFAALVARCAGRDDVIFMDGVLSTAEMLQLVSSCDIVLSLHRAEGFGLLLAEAMLLGKAVVATGWSGNMDFMSHATAALVDYRLLPVADPQGMYRLPTYWADPDVGHAATILRDLFADPIRRAELGAGAQAHALEFFDPRRIALVMERYLDGG